MIRPITDDYAVSPQLDPDDLSAVAAEGYRTVICNRPDAEVPPSHQAAAMRRAAEAVGLTFVENPIRGGMMTMDNVRAQADILAKGEGPVLAYCASGNRSTVVWALGRAGQEPTAKILEATRKAGYPLDGLAGQIDALAQA